MKFIGVIFFSIFLLNIVSAIPLVSFNFNTSSSSIQLVEPSIVRSSSAVFQISTERNVLCKYSQSSGTPYDSMEGSFDFNFGTLHKKNLINLVDGSRTYYIACRNSSDNTNSVLTASFNVITPVSAHISFSKYSPLSAGLSTVSVTTSKICASIPQLSFSYNGVSYNPIPLSGAGNSYSGYLLISPTLGNLVGSILFSCTDLEGFTGTEITSGSIFVVDTVYPKTLVDISSIGSKGRVQLSWRTDDQDISSYRIYRSIEPGVSFSQFYKEIYGSNSYTDTNVDSGKTYYYRITAIDQAGNEGELSIEVYGTALISDVNNTTSGLPISLYGLVDSSLTTIDSLLNDVERLTSTFEEKFSADKILLTDLGFSTEFDSVRSELRALKNDVEKYKSQTITQTELTKKLNAVELKINTLKKRIPEDIIISNRKTITQTLTEDDIRQVIFELNPSIEPNLLSKKLSRSFGAYVDFKFKTESTLSVFDIVYLDGSRSKRSLVHQHITSDLAGNGNVSIAEFIPKEFASNVEDINFKTPGYQVLKSDPIVSFLSDVTDIVYLINSPTDIDLISRIKTLPLYRDQSALESSTITGYLTLINVTSSKYSWIIVLSTLVIGFFGFSYFKLRNLTNRELNIIRNSINHAKNLIHQGNLGSAREIYSNIFNSYQKLPDNYKLAVHPEISELWGLINGA